MDEMTPFDRQIAGEVLRGAGPSESVDDAAILAAITAQSPRSRLRSMSRATRFVFAGAIVALFGGFLVAGVLTQPTVEMAPAAILESPSPVSTADLLAGFVTEDVEPGVLRVVNDGVRDLGTGLSPIVVAADGGVWQFATGTSGYARSGTNGSLSPADEPVFVRLGDEAEYPWPDRPLLWGDEDIEVSTDGAIWSTSASRPRIWQPSYTLTSIDLETGVVQQQSGTDGTETQPDGTVWVASFDGLRHYPAGWRAGDDVGAGSYISKPAGVSLQPESVHFAVAGDDVVWLVGRREPFVWRYAGDAWVAVDTSAITDMPPPTDDDAFQVDADAGDDGTLWLHIEAAQEGRSIMARLDATGWSTWTEADGVPSLNGTGWHGSSVTVAPDGSVWLVPEDRRVDGPGPCDGLVRFDGETWSRHLEGYCVDSFDIAPDGAAWVRAHGTSDDGGWAAGVPTAPTHTFVIAPTSGAVTD